jgi:hypothetical protein
MKKVWLNLFLILILLTVGGQGFQILGGSLAFGQPPGYRPYPPPPPPPPYYNPYFPPPPYDYYNYYSAPQADPLSQFLYSIVPQITGEQYRNDWVNREREYYEHRWRRHHGREGHEHGDDE